MRALSIACLLLCPPAVWAQPDPLDVYIDVDDLADDGDLDNLRPSARVQSFADYVMAMRQMAAIREVVDALRLNKLIGAASGTGGTTALVSSVATPAVVGVAIERGGIVRSNSTTSTTLRANLLGLAKLLVGATQFPYCPRLETPNCSAWSRRLRQVSGSVSFENRTMPGTQPATAEDLFGDDYRMSSWGVRVDLTPSNNLDDPGYVEAWGRRIEALRGSPEADALTSAIGDLLGADPVAFSDAEADLVAALRNADPDRRREVLSEQLDVFIARIREVHPGLDDNVRAIVRASASYRMVRDAAVRDAQVHKMSLEYAHLRPAAEPARSALRFIYSHQPTAAPVLVTVNVAAGLYHQRHGDESRGRLRDLQLAVQLGRRLPPIGRLQHPTLTFAGYYQWMRDDALLSIPAGGTAPGTTIEPAGDAATLLGTRGHIGIAQAQLSFPVAQNVRVPLSVSWANRTELVTESTVRGQIGFTVDLDTLFQ